jgi:hypothetical protein
LGMHGPCRECGDADTLNMRKTKRGEILVSYNYRDWHSVTKFGPENDMPRFGRESSRSGNNVT